MQVLSTPSAAADWLKGRVKGSLRTDSRQVRSGDGFIAWPGAASDARQYVASALVDGATACLVEQAEVERFGFADPAVACYRDLKGASGAIAAAYLGRPTEKLDVIAVTGTNGKTSTAWWLAHALSNLTLTEPFPCGFVGTLGIGYPVPRSGQTHSVLVLTANGLTTPDPVLLQQGFSDMLNAGMRACAVEASSIGLKEHRLNGTQIRVAIYTNFTQDHLDYHGSMSNYWEAKAILFKWPGLRAAVINIDDDKGVGLAAELGGWHATSLDVWTVSCVGPARLQAQGIVYGARGLSFVVVEGGTRFSISTSLIGQYNVVNLLGVIAAMRALGVPLAACVAACEDLLPVPGRMERLGTKDTPLVIVDYAHTPDALKKALAALSEVSKQRGGTLWCVFGCGGNRDTSKRPLMGAIAAEMAQHSILTSDNPRDESAQSIVEQIAAGIENRANVEVQLDRAVAIGDAVVRANAKDVILIAGKGHEDYQEIRGLKRPFSDRLQVQLALQARLPASLVSQGALS
jgi:UDP-N-acetylmuramyl-tripeptide synthetase